MDKTSFLSKIAMAAGVFAAMAFTSCSDDKDDNNPQWCVWDSEETQMCFEIGAIMFLEEEKMTKKICSDFNQIDGSASIKGEKPEGCRVMTYWPSGGSTGKWCVIGQGESQTCAEIGKNYIDNKEQKMTEDVCNFMNDIIAPGVASIKDEKPEDCEVMTD